MKGLRAAVVLHKADCPHKAGCPHKLSDLLRRRPATEVTKRPEMTLNGSVWPGASPITD